MVSPSDTYFASTPVIAMKPSGCLRLRECRRAGRGGRLIGFRRAKASPPRRPNLDVARARSREDKIVQRAVVALLNVIYEEDFLGISSGFRPGRSTHDALDALCVGIDLLRFEQRVDAA